MSIAFSLLYLLLAGPLQDLPHAFPRDGAKQLIDNQRVTVWEVTLEKGRPAPLHRHMYDMVSLELADAALQNINADKTARTQAVRVGQVIWNAKGLTHGEVGTSDTARRTIVIDFKDVKVAPLENKSGQSSAFPRDRAKKLLDNDRVTVWDYTWITNKPTPMHFHDKDVVVVFLADGQLNSTTPDGKTEANQISFGLTRFNGRDRVHSEELVKGSARAIIFELK